MKKYKILFVDDDPQILSIVERYLAHWGFNITTEADGRKALAMIQDGGYNVVFSDLIMPEIDGLAFLKQVKAMSPETEVIIVSGYGTIETAIEAMKLGSYDFLEKPINFDHLKVLIKRIFEKLELKEENQRIRHRLNERYKYDELVGISPKMQAIYRIIDKISFGCPTVLIQGESGTGKELTANVIHNNSDRQNGPFIPVNCGAISESLLERELFGHVKGAFTGASADAIGLFRAADRGTLFLDEIAEVSPAIQVSLLRALQEKKIRPVGDTKETSVDVRVIAATNKNLEQAIQNKTFREDLFYRLNVISITMPPLREMKDDIPLLVNHFIAKHRRSDTPAVMKASAQAMGKLMAFGWPGNIRQLENVVQRAIALGGEDIIDIDDLPDEISQRPEKPAVVETDFNLKSIERKTIVRALQATGGNKAQAAELLGVNTTTVYRKMEKYNLS
ncbi:MAG: DNA-binding response regulator [Deltaproteobacteria bacterium]|nr:MAG: DNA-binding response regulator [Deltaproteobacteria bacterium]